MKTFVKIKALFFCFTAVLTGFQFTSFAQLKTKEVNTINRTWTSINSNIRLSNKFGLMADLHVVRNNFLADPGFYFARLGANYLLKENIIITAGYAQLWAAPTKDGWHHYARERRIYEQIQMSTKVGKVGLINRIRNEQRWQEKIVNDKFINSYKFTNRVRYLLSMTVPVFKNPHYPSLVLADELAIQFGKEIIYNTFDQNRLFFGIKQPISKTLSFDLGYMMVYQQKASGYQYDKINTLRLFFYYTPDLRKKHKV
jgi:hypothetical protein